MLDVQELPPKLVLKVGLQPLKPNGEFPRRVFDRNPGLCDVRFPFDYLPKVIPRDSAVLTSSPSGETDLSSFTASANGTLAICCPCRQTI